MDLRRRCTNMHISWHMNSCQSCAKDKYTPDYARFDYAPELHIIWICALVHSTSTFAGFAQHVNTGVCERVPNTWMCVEVAQNLNTDRKCTTMWMWAEVAQTIPVSISVPQWHSMWICAGVHTNASRCRNRIKYEYARDKFAKKYTYIVQLHKCRYHCNVHTCKTCTRYDTCWGWTSNKTRTCAGVAQHLNVQELHAL